MEMKRKKVFNENGNDSLEDRKLIGGNSTGILNLNTIKYKWATQLLGIMQNNFWLPQKVSLVEDKVTLKELTEHELSALKNTLSFLIALDSMQVNTLPVLSDYITAPEVSACLTVQAYQELVHSQSYQYILQELFPNLDREEIYDYWRSNPLLLKRNKAIADLYIKFNRNRSEDSFKLAIAADFVLEGIYFYIGFNFFYQLASRNKGVGLAKVIKYIENDEVTHVSLMSYLVRDLLISDEDKKMLEEVIRAAVEQEIEWGIETYGDNILGVSKESTEQYVKYLANQRAKLVGLGTLYKGFNTNPYEHLNTRKKENYFETNVTEYSQSTAVEGWDDF
jgi:ribonucleoside-diphosphate reductase beta chain